MTSSERSKTLIAGAILVAALVGFLVLVGQQDGASRFGTYHDDTLYWTVAGAIADGKGAVMPSLPGEPALTKYPILYPYLLSAVWTPLAENPAGLAIAVGSSAVFAVWALIFSFLQLRRWRGVGDLQAALCVGACVLSAALLTLSSAVLSDALFFALGATALWFAELDHRRGWIGAAVFAGLAMLTRSVGVAVIGGIVISYFLQRRYKTGLSFGLLATPFAAFGVLGKFSAPAASLDGAPGYRQTWLYYNDYIGFWRTSMPDAETLMGLLQTNLLETLRSPTALALGPEPPGPVGLTIWVTLTVAIISGLYRQIQGDRVRAYHCALVLHLPFTMLWNFEIASRLLLLFLPLFWIGLSTELRHAAMGFVTGLKGSRPTADRVISVIGLVLMTFGVGWWATRTVSAISAVAPATRTQATRYADLADWFRVNSSPQDRLIAIDDGFLYTHTGRQGMWPLALATDLRFHASEERLEQQLGWLPDVAEEIGARYLVWTDNDYRFAPPVQDEWAQWASTFCEVMRSEQGDVKLYDLACLAEPTFVEAAAQL